MTEPAAYQPVTGAPAGWYPLPGGGQRYWDGHTWVGNPMAPTAQQRRREPPDPRLVWIAVMCSVLLTPIAGLVMGLLRLRKNRSDGWKMIGAAIAVFVIISVVIALGNKLNA